MAGHLSESATGDPCAALGRERFFAWIWFISVLIISAVLAFQFARIDRFMYDTNAETFDLRATRETRYASTSLPGDNLDARTQSGSTTLLGKLISGQK